MLDFAKDVDEPLFCELLRKYPLANFPYRIENVEMASDGMDMKGHADVRAMFYPFVEGGDGGDGGFDVKDVEEANMPKGNYTLSKETVETLGMLNSRYRFFAFRLNDRVSKRLDAFLIACARDVIGRCGLDDRGGYFLVNVDEVRKLCDTWTLETDVP